MKIGLNGQRILIENPAGPEIFTINLFKALSKVDKENKYLIYFNKKPEDDFFKGLVSDNPNFSFKVLDYKHLWTQLGLATELIKNPVDVFFTAVHTIPMIRSSKTKFVSMIHGLEYKFTEGYKNPINRLKIERPIKYAAKFSDKIIAPSKATKEEILKRSWGIADEKIEIVYEGVSEIFCRKETSQVDQIRKKYELSNDPYLLFVSTIQPRKNIPSLVRAFSQFLNENKEMGDTRLLIAGKKGWDFEESLEAPRQYGIEQNVKFLGRVPTEDLPSLFSGAKAYVNTSFEEGFGLPLLESMACGIPSVVSDIPAHREVGGDLPNYVDPHNVENIKDGIFKVITTKYNENILIERSKQFTWKKTAERTLEIMREVSGK